MLRMVSTAMRGVAVRSVQAKQAGTARFATSAICSHGAVLRHTCTARGLGHVRGLAPGHTLGAGSALGLRLGPLYHASFAGQRPFTSSTVASAAATEEAAPPQEETYQYQAEVDRLMDMIVNSLYSNREVFLRELVSNASDALDKIRLMSLTDAAQLPAGDELDIRIQSDEAARTITIEDTGVGMTKQELLDSLGTIARSGTARFAQAMKDSQGDANLIGQFGVGFYSSFLVADRVTVTTKNNADADAWEWESSAGAHSYKIRKVDAPDLPRGTRITLHLKEDAAELADPKKLSELIKQYSEFIQFPIKLWSPKTEYEEVVDEEKTAKAREEAKKAFEEKEEKEGEFEEPAPVMKSEKKEVWDWRVQNDNKPLWARSPKDVTKDEYDSFYKLTFKEFLEPLAVSHFNVEGTIEFTAMLFVPGMAPFEQNDWMKKSRNIRLFVKRVFISDEFDEDLMPRWLSFVKGVVDSTDLPLNVSREILQESRVVRVIKKQLVKRSIDMLKDIAGRPREEKKESDYDTFYESFGKFVKLGAIEDAANKNAIAELLRFPSSKSGDKMVGLAEYVSRMKEDQKDIYYIASESLDAASSAPFVEQLIKKDLEVLYLVEPIDEPALNSVSEFQGKKFVDVTREDLELGGDVEETKKKVEEAAEQYKGLIDTIKNTLGDKVEKVVVSQRLADSPCALVTSKFGWSAHQERVMKSQALGDQRAMEYMRGRKTLEINPDHPVIAALAQRLADSDPGVKSTIELLYDTAILTSGFSVESPKDFANRIYGMMNLVAGGKSNGGGSNGSSAPKQPAPEAVTPDQVLEKGDDPWRS